MNSTLIIAFLLFSYLLGSIPVGYLLTHFSTGKNIMELGSGNVGSTNVGRIAGKRMAILTQLSDMAKGLLPVALYLTVADEQAAPFDIYLYGVAMAAILGHDFSIFLKFKGGKGVNTTLGASLLLAPIAVFLSVGVYFVVKWRFKYVSLGSILLAIALPFSELIMHGFTLTAYYLMACMGLIILRHKSNLVRLINQQELSS